MGRRSSAIKQDATNGENLTTLETARRLAHGTDEGLEKVVSALQFAAVASDLTTMPGPAGLLVRWLVKAATDRDGGPLRRLATRISKRGLFDAADPIASCLRSYAIQCSGELPNGDKFLGETPRDTLRRLPMERLLAALAARGIAADETTVRKTLNRLGVQRPRGRPKKTRDS